MGRELISLVIYCRCPSCREIGWVTIHEYGKIISSELSSVTCEHCKQSFPAHLWEIVNKDDEPWSVS